MPFKSFGSEDLRQWLVRMELLLFRQRWDQSAREERQMFLENSGFDFNSIPSGEKERIMDFLIAGSSSMDVTAEAFFKVPFESVPDLVAHREVYLSDGWAYVPQSCLLSIVISELKVHLFQALEVSAKNP
jgi:DNA primase large subunit